MEPVGKYLTATKMPPRRGQAMAYWRIVNAHDGLAVGAINWSSRFNRYVFDAATASVFDLEELCDIAAFLAKCDGSKVDTIFMRAADIAALCAALRLPASTPWPDVLARARSLAERDPARTLDDEGLGGGDGGGR